MCYSTNRKVPRPERHGGAAADEEFVEDEFDEKKFGLGGFDFEVRVPSSI